MKRIALIVATLLTCITLSAQIVGYDEVSISVGNITGNDTTLFPETKRINNCMGNLVTTRFTIKNTDAVTDTFLLGGRDSDVQYDYSGAYFEVLDHSALPFIIDTTDVDLNDISFTYDATGGYYHVTFSRSGYPYKTPGVKITKWALSQGDITVYFYNSEDHGQGNIDSDELTPNDTVNVNLAASADTLNVKSLSYDATSGSDQTTHINPEWAHRTTPSDYYVGADETVDQHYSSIIDMDTYRQGAIQLKGDSDGSGVTFKVYATIDLDAATPADGDATPSNDWVDVSAMVLDAASVTLDGGASCYRDIPIALATSRLIVQSEPDNAGNASTVIVVKSY